MSPSAEDFLTFKDDPATKLQIEKRVDKNPSASIKSIPKSLWLVFAT